MIYLGHGRGGVARLDGRIARFLYLFDFAICNGKNEFHDSHLAGDPDYSLLFYIADGLSVLVVLLISRLDVDVERMESGNLAAGVKRLVRLIDVDVFIFMMLLLGTCWGFLESFLFVFLMELKANSYLLGSNLRIHEIIRPHSHSLSVSGMTVTLGCVIGVPFLYISDLIVRKIGSVNVFVVAFVIYCIRFFGYSLIWYVAINYFWQ